MTENEKYTRIHKLWVKDVENEYSEQYEKRKELFDTLGAKELSQLGHIAFGYNIISINAGMYSRIIMDVAYRKTDKGERVTFGSGSCVSVYFLSSVSPDTTDMSSVGKSDAVCSGIVHSLTAEGFHIALDSSDIDDMERLQKFEGSKVSIVLDDSKKVLDKKLEILRHMEKWPEKLGSKFQPTTAMFNFQFDEVDFNKYKPKLSGTHKYPSLNKAQSDAVEIATDANIPIYCIHGPPGTGKTTTISFIAKKLVSEGNKVLCCAPSNVAVDNMIYGCKSADISPKLMLRLGHPARVSDDLVTITLDHRVSNNRDLKKAKREEKKLRSKIEKTTDKKERQDCRKELKNIMFESRNNNSVIYDTIRTAQIVFCTPVGASQQSHTSFVSKSGDYPYDVVLVDEAAQAFEFETWNVIRFGRCAILAGDPMQLPPVSIAGNTPMSLMEVLFKKKDYKKNCSVLLNIQYRMHPNILKWSNDHFYGNKMESADICINRNLSNIETYGLDLNPIISEALKKAFVSIDTSAEDDFKDSTQIDSINPDLSAYVSSHLNVKEAEFLVEFLWKILIKKLNVLASTVIVITPYRSQRQLLKELINANPELANIEVGTIDGFQGREADVVIISLVRSNDKQNIGFLSDYRRMNVAITRARKLCILIGDNSTVIEGKDKILNKINVALESIPNDPVQVMQIMTDLD